MSTDLPPIPEEIKDEFGGREQVKDLRGIHGWAIGTVVELDEDGNTVKTYEDVWIELFEEGETRILVHTNGTYKEKYAHPSDLELTDNIE